jgi:hypothetical protein
MSANAANELLARVVEAIGMYQQDLISIRWGTGGAQAGWQRVQHC